MRIPNRRQFLWISAALWPAAAAAEHAKRSETVVRFLTPEYDGRMSVQFIDQYSSRGFWFSDRLNNREFCLSGKGEEGRACLPKFTGSLAIAVYHFRARPHVRQAPKLRERVLTIDHDSHLDPRPPFEGTLDMKGEVVSDIQAFGYNRDDPAEAASGSALVATWCFLRQDLFLDGQDSPFLIVHWKHTLNAITLIDVIPGERTRLVST